MALAASTLINLNLRLIASAVSSNAFGIPLILDTEDVLAGGTLGKVHSYSTLADMTDDGYNPWNKAYKLAKEMLSQSPKVPLFKVGCIDHASTSADLTALETLDPEWYGFNVTSRADQSVKDCSEWAESTAANRHVFWAETNSTVGTGGANILSYLFNAARTRTLCAAQAGVAQVKVITIPTAFASDASVTLNLNGTEVGPVAYNTNTNTTLTNLATALQATTAIATAVADTTAKTITCTAYDSLVDLYFEKYAGGGATPTNATYETTVESTIPLDSGILGRITPLGAGKVTVFGQTIAGAVPSVVSPTFWTNVSAQRGNIYTTIGGKRIVLDGTCSADVAVGAPLFADQILGLDVLESRLYTALIGVLTPNDGTKLSYDDAGITAVVGAILGAAQLSVNDGYLKQFDPGNCINAPVAANVPLEDRSLRILNGIVANFQATGAIQHLGSITVNVAV